jgi:hypothetical protein
MPMQVAITGNTYPVKEALKALGARWNGDSKAWMISADKADQARKIVAESATTAATQTKSAYRPSRCSECRCAGSQYNPIYRSGVCRQCWVSEKEEREMGY